MTRTNGGVIGPIISTSANTVFAAGNQTITDLYDIVQDMSNENVGSATGVWDLRSHFAKVKSSAWPSVASAFGTTPTAGGSLTVNGSGSGNYDYVIFQGDQTVSSFLNTNFFTTDDDRCAFVVVKGNLTIDSGQTLIPSNRKLFTCIYVTGNCTINGGISMTARGGNHHPSGPTGGIASFDLRINTGTFSGVPNPQIPATGGSGGSTSHPNTPNGTYGSPGGNGSNGSNGGTGGGGSGGASGQASSYSAPAGSVFSGAPSPGGKHDGGVLNLVASQAQGGTGGQGNGGAGQGSAGGTGNPGGYAINSPSPGSGIGNEGTGGILILFVDGTLSGSGSVTANGVDGITAGTGAGGSGGGSVTIFYGTDSSSITPTAQGGTGGPNAYPLGPRQGGNGGAGTARKLVFA
jgi:hypothetical protein